MNIIKKNQKLLNKKQTKSDNFWQKIKSIWTNEHYKYIKRPGTKHEFWQIFTCGPQKYWIARRVVKINRRCDSSADCVIDFSTNR